MNIPQATVFLISALLAGCVSHSPPEVATSPMGYVEAGKVTPHEVWKVKRALSKAGIPAYADGKDYPLPYRMLVPPEKRDAAKQVIEKNSRIKTE